MLETDRTEFTVEQLNNKKSVSKLPVVKLILAMAVGLLVVIPTVLIMWKGGVWEGAILGAIMLIMEALLIHL